MARLGKIFYPAVVAAGFAGLGSVKLGRNHRFFTSIGEPLGEGDRISPGAGEVITAAVGKPPDHDAEMGRMRYRDVSRLEDPIMEIDRHARRKYLRRLLAFDTENDAAVADIDDGCRALESFRKFHARVFAGGPWFDDQPLLGPRPDNRFAGGFNDPRRKRQR